MLRWQILSYFLRNNILLHNDCFGLDAFFVILLQNLQKRQAPDESPVLQGPPPLKGLFKSIVNTALYHSNISTHLLAMLFF